MKEFIIEDQYQIFLKKAGLCEKSMPAIQQQQLRLAFNAAIGQLMISIRTNIPELPEDKAVEFLENIWQQSTNFFYRLKQFLN